MRQIESELDGVPVMPAGRPGQAAGRDGSASRVLDVALGA